MVVVLALDAGTRGHEQPSRIAGYRYQPVRPTGRDRCVRRRRHRRALSKFISFAIGDDQYGVDIMAVREIKGWSQITHLPKQPDYVRGVLNLRGVMVPIIDLRCRFGQGMTEATPLHIVIVVQIGAAPSSACWPIGCSTSSSFDAVPDPAGAARRPGGRASTSCPGS